MCSGILPMDDLGWRDPIVAPDEVLEGRLSCGFVVEAVLPWCSWPAGK